MSEEVDAIIQVLQALFVCNPCINGKHEECEAPCGCALHPPTGKVNPDLENFGKDAVTFTQEQREQIKQYMKKGKR